MSTPFDPRPIVLEGDRVRLEPLDLEHAVALFEAGSDAAIWAYMPRPVFRDLADCQEWIAQTRAEMESTESVAFAIHSIAHDRAVGSTRLFDFDRASRGLEIGWTWLGTPYQRTAINTEAKFLLLRHAFEDLEARRVQLKTDARNLASQRAIERLGASREGVLRRQRLVWDGCVRDTVYYSIIDTEWPEVKARLRALVVRNHS